LQVGKHDKEDGMVFSRVYFIITPTDYLSCASIPGMYDFSMLILQFPKISGVSLIDLDTIVYVGCIF
jgi:hypothetical protein